METLKIIGLCVGSAVLYGILHDQVTTRVCIEYFTIAHPPVFGTESPTLLAFGWGVIATWWVGLGLSVPIALTARAGSRPKLTARALVPPIGCLLLVMGLTSLMAGLAGFQAAVNGQSPPSPWAAEISEPKHAAFLACLWAHNMAYAAGMFGGILLSAWVWVRRWRLARNLLTRR